MSEVTRDPLRTFFETIRLRIPVPLRRILFYDDIIDNAIDQYAKTFLDVGGGKNKLLVSISQDRKQSYFVNTDAFLPSLSAPRINDSRLKVIQNTSLTEDYISEPFSVILGDDLTIAKSLNNLIKSFWENDAWAVEGIMPESSIDVLKRTCCVTLENNGRIKEIKEKPTEPRSRLRGTGVYLFHPLVFEFIRKTPTSPKRNEKEITDTIGLIARERKAYGVLIDGVNLNINALMDLSRATKTPQIRG